MTMNKDKNKNKYKKRPALDVMADTAVVFAAIGVAILCAITALAIATGGLCA